MAAFSLASRRRLVAACAVAGLLVATGSAGAAATPASPSAPAASTSATTTSTATPRKPNATAPTQPADYGPPCTTNATAQNPVICLPANSGEDKAAPLTPGGDTAFGAQVVNNGPAVADADVLITLPAGLSLGDDGGYSVVRVDNWYSDDQNKSDFKPLTCPVGPAAITCSLGALAKHANILVLVLLHVSKDAAPGTRLTFHVELQAVGTPTYASTSVSATIDVLAPSELRVGLTPATVHTVVGHRARITGIVHNIGAGPAPDSFAIAITINAKHPDDTHFTITNGQDFDGGETGGGTVVIVGTKPASPVRSQLQRQVVSLPTRSSARRHTMPSLGLWPLGTIAPGATATVQIELKAHSVGTDLLAFSATSADTDFDESDDSPDGCDIPGVGAGTDSGVPSATPLARNPRAVSTTTAPAACPFLVVAHITAIPQPVTAPLANTGTRTEKELGIALWALVVGSLLVWAGRRRGITVRRHG